MGRWAVKNGGGEPQTSKQFQTGDRVWTDWCKTRDLGTQKHNSRYSRTLEQWHHPTLKVKTLA